MAPLYEVILLTKAAKDLGGGTEKLKTLLKKCATHIWDRGGILADIRPWGQRELAYRIRKQQVNHYDAHYTSMLAYISPPTLHSLEKTLRTDDTVLRHLTLKQESTPTLDKAARDPKYRAHLAKLPKSDAVDLEADPSEAARWEYRNLVMQRVFEGRTKSELIAEQMVRYKFQHTHNNRPMPEPPRYSVNGPMVAALRKTGEPPAVEGGGGGGGETPKLPEGSGGGESR